MTGLERTNGVRGRLVGLGAFGGAEALPATVLSELAFDD